MPDNFVNPNSNFNDQNQPNSQGFNPNIRVAPTIINTNQNQPTIQSNPNYNQQQSQTFRQSIQPNNQNQNPQPNYNQPQTRSFSPSQLNQLKNLRQQNNPQPGFQPNNYNQNPHYQHNQPQNYRQQLGPQFNSQPYNQPLNTEFGISFDQTQPQHNIENQPQSKNPKLNLKFSFKALWQKIRVLVFSLLALLSLAGIGFGAWTFIPRVNLNTAISLDKITASIVAPTSLSQGTVGKWNVKIRNDESFAIDDLQLTLKYDQDFQTTNFPNYKPVNNTNNTFSVGKLDQFGVGTQDAVVDIEGFLNAQVDIETSMSGSLTFYSVKENGTKSEQKSEIPIAISKTKVTSPDVQLTVTPAVGQIQNGGEAEFIIKVKNTKENDYQDLRLRLYYPAGNIFSYESSQFTSSNTSQKITTPNDGDDTWYISRLAGLSEQTLSVKGKVTVKSEQKVPLKVTLSKKSNSGEYKDLKTAIKDILVTNQPVVINTSFEKGERTFSSGETLKVNIDYFNQSQDTLKNVEILGFVNDKSNLLDLGSIAFTGGNRAFINNSQIQWTGNNTPQLVSLAPQVKGQLSYSINVKNSIINNKKSQGDYVITPQVQIKAINLQEITAGGDEYKMNSSLRFSQADTQEVPIANNTNTNRKRYKLAWTLSNEQNQIDNIVIKTRTSLPPTAFIKSSVKKPAGSELTYNPSNGEILFKLDKIVPYTGLDDKKPELSVSFEFEIDQQSTSLIDAPAVSAQDNFTGEFFNITGKASETRS
jgi:hypothetical protein